MVNASCQSSACALDWCCDTSWMRPDMVILVCIRYHKSGSVCGGAALSPAKARLVVTTPAALVVCRVMATFQFAKEASLPYLFYFNSRYFNTYLT